MKNLRLIGIWLTAGLILLIPLIAMQFTTEVNWTKFDFLVAGVLLFGTGLLLELALRIVQKFTYRVAVCAAILLGLFVIWAELAVGLIGTRFAGH
ncbi:MAG: hypothetical protein K1X72_17930 [Pyrinomonadaceae bacterium]|nr:hypothetical protein [Pyrinomonadaceae bacterium]